MRAEGLGVGAGVRVGAGVPVPAFGYEYVQHRLLVRGGGAPRAGRDDAAANPP